MKRKTTKEILADSFRELAETKAVNKITIQEIADNCDYSPATFYRHFRDKYDLMAWDYAEHCRQIMAGLQKEARPWKDSVTEGCRYLYSQRQYMKNLFEHTSGHDSFVENMCDINIGILSGEVAKKTHQAEMDERLSFMIHFFCCGLGQIWWKWLTGSSSYNAESLAALIVEALPEPLKPYLLDSFERNL